MFSFTKAALLRLVLVAAISAGIGIGWAQSPSLPSPPRPDPADPAAAVPAMVYQSVFGQYQRPSADKAIPWKAANDEVGRIGGWRAYAREANPADATGDKPVAVPTASPAVPESRNPAQSGHAGHSSQK